MRGTKKLKIRTEPLFVLMRNYTCVTYVTCVYNGFANRPNGLIVSLAYFSSTTHLSYILKWFEPTR